MSRRLRSHTLIALAASAALVLAAGLTLAAAGPLVHSETAPTVQRQVVWLGSPSQSAPRAIRISSESVGAPSPDAFQITYADGSFSLEYQRQANGSVTSDFNLTLRNLVEWNDTNENGIADDGIVEVAAPLGSIGFGNLPIRHSLSSSSDGGDVHSFLIPSNDQKVQLNLTIGERFVPISSQQRLTPMEAKLTIDIQHHFVHPGWNLGLEIGISTTNNVTLEDTSWDDEHEFSDDDRSLNVTNDSSPEASTTFFAWANTASVNGQDRPVTVTGPEENESNPGYYDMVLAYPVSSELPAADVRVVHDPTLGVVSVAYESLKNLPIGDPNLHPDVPLYAASLALVAGLVAATIILASRRRGQ